MDTLLNDLLITDGISGYESNISYLIKSTFDDICNKKNVITDNFGNVICKIGNGQKKIMITAHMDEIGMIVKHIDKNGFLRFIKVGGINDSILPGTKVEIINKQNQHIQGVIGVKPPHIMTSDEIKQSVKSETMFIDIGINSKDKVSKVIEIGDQIIFEPKAGVLNNSFFYGKAVDNRIGCYIIIKVLEQFIRKQNLDIELYVCATVQEEVGLKGGYTAAFNIKPDFALVIDTTIAGDTPEIKQEVSSLELGKGPAITFIEACGRGAIITHKVQKFLLKVARDNNIAYQIDVIDGGVTDAALIQTSQGGILSGVLSVPTRYIHSPISVFNINDVISTINFTSKILENIHTLLFN
ncbi:MAG: hypothetical protein LBM05_01060 [Endomicrobium sp.]|jgi:endoglucanase|nr:hypothetical protein [Endomicrobium sp.]